MRKFLIGAAMVAMATGAQAQTSAWHTFEGEKQGDFTPVQAFVQSDDGNQLILKCDKPGEFRTYAVIVTKTNLAMSSAGKFENRPVRMRFDDGSAIDDQWRFNSTFAMAMNERSVRTFTRLLEKMADANKFWIHLEPFRQSPVEATFPVTGAREAIDKVFTACKDKNPLAG